MVRPILHAVLRSALLFAVPWCLCLPMSYAAAPADAARGSLYDRVRAQYPETIPPFVRTGFRAYDKQGEHVSVGYTRFFLLATPVTVFTAYFSPLPPGKAGEDAIADYLDRSREEVLKAHPGAQTIATGAVTAEKKGRTIKGNRITFKFDTDFGAPGKRQTVLSELYLFRDGQRAVKYRITFPAAEERTEREHLEKFLAAFPWPE